MNEATHLDEFDLKDAILVGTQKRLKGIITVVDVLRYCFRVAAPCILIRQIELAIEAPSRLISFLIAAFIGTCARKLLLPEGGFSRAAPKEKPTGKDHRSDYL